MVYKSKKVKLIAVDEKNYEELRQLGHTPESFNDIVTKLLQQNQNQKQILTEVKAN